MTEGQPDKPKVMDPADFEAYLDQYRKIAGHLFNPTNAKMGLMMGYIQIGLLVVLVALMFFKR